MYLTPPLRLKVPANQGGFVKGGAQNRARLRRKFSLLRGVYARRRRKILEIWDPLLHRKHVPECTLERRFLC